MELTQGTLTITSLITFITIFITVYSFVSKNKRSIETHIREKEQIRNRLTYVEKQIKDDRNRWINENQKISTKIEKLDNKIERKLDVLVDLISKNIEKK